MNFQKKEGVSLGKSVFGCGAVFAPERSRIWQR